jgi:hypothetical protein
MSLPRLSTELQQLILGYLDFISLLNFRNTNPTFRDLVDTSLSKPGVIPPARVKLLELYQELHLSLIPPTSSHDVLNNEIKELLNARKYISSLQSQIAYYAPKAKLKIPAEFEYWALEWPQHAPLSFSYLKENDGDRFWRGEDAGEKLSFQGAEGEGDADLVGVFIREHGCTDYTTLFFESGEGWVNDDGRGGKVWIGDICEMAEIESWEEGENLAGCWTEWLRSRQGNGW